MRETMANAAAAGHWKTTPPVETVSLGGMRCVAAKPAGSSRATIMHFHGGGYRLGRPDAMAPFATELARRANVKVICPEYRLAPEYPFPAALHDGATAIEAIAGEQGALFIAGDSAGGGLAASLACLSQRTNIIPTGLILLSPWVDLRVSAESYRTNAQNDPIFSQEAALASAALYLQGHDPTDPLASPGIADVSQCPPTYISVGESEVLLNDALSFYRKLVDAGVQASLSVVPDMQHVAVTRDLEAEGAHRVMNEIVHFIENFAPPTSDL